MQSSNVQEVLRCRLCNKPFDKKATLKRHGYYCRDKKGSNRKARLRSCLSCIKAKTRCDTGRPSCARCESRIIPCAYPGRITRSNAYNTTSPAMADGKVAAEVEDSTLAWLTTISRELTDTVSLPTEGALDILNPSFLNFESKFADWTPTVISFGDLQDQSSEFDQVGTLTSPYNTVPPLHEPTHAPESRLFHNGWLQSPSIPRMPTYHLRAFARNRAAAKSSATATLLTHILTSYPRMLCTPTSLPPFVHHYSLHQTLHSQTSAFESLTTCVSLMQIASSRAPGSRKLLWKNIKLECERLQFELANFDKWGLLSTLQALTIYILVRLQEGETPDNNYDILLLSSLWATACALNEQVNFGICVARSGLFYGPSHKEWIFEESRRRLALIYQILEMLYSMDPASACAEPDGFLLAPLPSRKQLWDASEEKLWVAEKSLDGAFPSVFGILSGGQMVRLKEHHAFLESEVDLSQGIGPEESAANWQEWCTGMDGFGALVTLATSLASA